MDCLAVIALHLSSATIFSGAYQSNRVPLSEQIKGQIQKSLLTPPRALLRRGSQEGADEEEGKRRGAEITSYSALLRRVPRDFTQD